MNGLLDANQDPHPGLFAHKQVQRNVHVQAVDLEAGVFLIENRYDATVLSDAVYGQWKLEANGQQIAEGALPTLGIDPHTTQTVTLDLPSVIPEVGTDYFLTLEFYAQKGFHPLVAEGHRLAYEQFELPAGKSIAFPRVQGSMALLESDTTVTVTGADFEVVFDKVTGLHASYRMKDARLMNSGGRPEFSRAKNDNEMRQNPKSDPAWDTAGATATIQEIAAEQGEDVVTIRVRAFMPELKAGFAAVYTLLPSGEIIVEAAFNFEQTPKKMLPPLRIGMEWTLPNAFENIEWFGRAGETYADQKFAPVGRFSGTVDGQWVDYPRPQENGNKTDVRWVSLSDTEGRGVVVAAEGGLLEVSARHYSLQTMRDSAYSFQMERSKHILLMIDAIQCGVGGISSWGARALDAYRPLETTYRYTYRILPRVENVEQTLAHRASFSASDVAALAVPTLPSLPAVSSGSP